MNTKTKALALLSVIVVAAVAGSFVLAMQSMGQTDTMASVAQNTEATPSAVTETNDDLEDYNQLGSGLMAVGMEWRFGRNHRGMNRYFGAFGPGAIQISSDFTENVTNIAKNDNDVQNLLSQNYNITSVRPVITTTVDGNGNIVTQASTANLTLLGTNGRAFVVVDLTQAKVIKIVTLTVSVIDK